MPRDVVRRIALMNIIALRSTRWMSLGQHLFEEEGDIRIEKMDNTHSRRQQQEVQILYPHVFLSFFLSVRVGYDRKYVRQRVGLLFSQSDIE